MEMSSSKTRTERGSVLVVSLCIAFIIGATLAGYLMLVQNQSRSVARSQTWNSSLAVTEAGIEDGMQFINKYAGTPILSQWSNNATADNWSQIGSGVYKVSRPVGPDSSIRYTVYVSNFFMGPTLYAISSVPAPLSGVPLERKIFVRTKRNPLFNYALAAEGKIDLKGNNVSTDSFDSGDTNASSNGMYDPTRRKGNGDVVTNGTFTNSVSVGNADIMGHVNTGPKGTVTLGANGSIGSVPWVTGGSTGIEDPSYVDSTMNVDFPEVSSPDTIYPISSSSWVGILPAGGTFDVAGDYYYKLTSTFTESLYVGTNVHLVLWLTAGASLSGGDSITVAPGGTLTIYTAGSFTMTGSSQINNQNAYAQNFALLGLTNCTSINLNGNGDITAVIYAPNSNLSVGGGGSTEYDFVGSGMAKTIDLNGHMKFHFDEALEYSDFSRGYIASYWKEAR